MIGLRVIELLVERAVTAQHAVENVSGNATRREARNFRFGSEIAAHFNFISETTCEGSNQGGGEPQRTHPSAAFRQELGKRCDKKKGCASQLFAEVWLATRSCPKNMRVEVVSCSVRCCEHLLDARVTAAFGEVHGRYANGWN